MILLNSTSLNVTKFLFLWAFVPVAPPLHAALTAPTDGAVTTAGPAAIAISWTDNETFEENYELEIDGSTVVSLSQDATNYYARGFAAGSSHRFRVRAVNNESNSAWLDIGSATTMSYQPNILYFLADDMGYKDIVGLRDKAIDGPTLHETPELDRFIGNFALSVNNAYCSGPRCVVARRSMQTGKYDWRPEAVPNNKYYLDADGHPIGAGLWGGGTTVAGSIIGTGVNIPDNETYGEALQSAGYRTCFIGKYHLGESPPTLHTPTGYSFGDQPGRGPIDQGYDVSIAAGHAGAPPASYFAVLNQKPGAAPGEYTFELPNLDDTNYMRTPAVPAAGDYLTDRLTDKAIGFIDDAINHHGSQPFHLTLAHYAVHTPIEAPGNASAPDGKGYEYFQARKAARAAEFAAHPAGDALVTDYSSRIRITQDNAVYAAMMKSYDASFGAIWSYLQATNDPRNPGKKLSETTIVVVSSDHGGKSTNPIDDNKFLEDDSTDSVNPAPVLEADNEYRSSYSNTYNSYPTSNYPYRFGKTWVFEGGLKVPLLIYIPGMTTGGTHSDAFVHHADLFASFIDMAGGAQSANSTDSISFMLPATQPQKTARDESFHFFTNASTGTGNPAIGAYRKGDYKLLYFMVQRRVELYNLAADPYEKNDLAASRPDVAAEMLKELYQQVLSTGLNMPKPGSNTWSSEQSILLENGLIASLPLVPDAAPSWVGAGATQISDRTIELNWQVTATNATHSVLYRRADALGETNFREIAYLPAGVTTYRDTDLVPGGQYRYRVESENLGGWASDNTGNKSLVLSNPGPGNLSCDAVDDTVTTVPGEARSFHPLINDEGEGALKIISITQPASGSARIEGKTILFTAPDGFAGGLTMTYTAEDATGQTDTALVTFSLPLGLSDAVLERWDFNESATTQLEATRSFSGLLFDGITSPGVAANGAGQLVISPDSTSHFRVAKPVTGSPYTSGQFTMEIKVDTLDFSNSSNGSSLGLSFRDFTRGADFGNLRLRKNDGLTVMEVRTGATNQRVYDFGNNLIHDLTIYCTLNLDTVPATISTVFTLGAGPLIGPIVSNADTTATVFDAIRFQTNSDKIVSPDTIVVDYWKISKRSNRTSLYDAFSSTYPWYGNLATGAEDDADQDGLSNLFEFAFGLSLTESGGVSPVEVAISGPDPVLLFTPFRDTSAVKYTVQFTNDLNDWNHLPEVSVATAAGVLVEEKLPSGNTGFGRISIALP